MTLFNPPIFQFYSCTKTSERVFQTFSSSNSLKILENTFQSSFSRQKNTSENAFQNLKLLAKIKIQGEES
jgi:ABC-type polar amino acid transport system ATPase subunit